MMYATFKRVVLVVALMVVTLSPVLARNQNKSLTIPRPCVVSGQNLTAGTYTAQFADDQAGQLVILDGRKEVVRMSYKLVTLPKPATGDTVVFNNNNGTRTISRIEFKGLTTALSFE